MSLRTFFFGNKIKCKSLYNQESRTIDMKGLSGSSGNYDLGLGSFSVSNKYKEASDELQRLDLLQLSICNNMNGIKDSKLRDQEIIKRNDALTEMMNVIQGIQKKEEETVKDINKKLKDNKIPPITKDKLGDIQYVDSLMHPNDWQRLHTAYIKIPTNAIKDDAHLKEILNGLFQIIQQCCVKLYGDRFRRIVINIQLKKMVDPEFSELGFISNNGELINQLVHAFTKEGREEMENSFMAETKDYFFVKKLIFYKGCSVEIEFDPKSKKITFRNAPYYEGEPIENHLSGRLHLQKKQIEHIQRSSSKLLGFLGRIEITDELASDSNQSMSITFDLPDDVNLNPNIMRLFLCMTNVSGFSYDLIRLSVNDSEIWDYAYDPDLSENEYD